MLIAVHLSYLPSALILDEPDWGLSRSAAVAFVGAVVEKAHGLGIPVIIISHKPWWRSMAADILEITKETLGNQPVQLRIRLKKVDTTL
jgi:ABC-type multidrug transport system ATPase subunit